MRLIKQSKLVFYAGRTQKIYEIDLCEVAPDRYVVNFRYGRRGGATKDGSKTAIPVGQAEAERVFEELEQSKLRAGYVHEGASPPPVAAAPPPPRSTAATSARPAPSAGLGRGVTLPAARSGVGSTRDEIARGVLARLARGEVHTTRAMRRASRRGHRVPQVWSFSRSIWRAGELALREAEPYLLAELGRGEAIHQYSVVWALGRCGASASIPPLERLAQSAHTAEHVRRIAGEALRLLYRQFEPHRAELLQASALEQLPEPMRRALQAEDAEALTRELADHLAGERAQRYRVLELLYQVEHRVARQVLLEELRRAPLRPPWFQRLRYLFKAAEYRRDGQVFGLLAYRFAKEPAMFLHRGRWGVRAGNRYYNRNQLQQELASPNAQVAYGSRTRNWLRRRVWRTLKRLGELGDPDFVPMAVGVLLPFQDEDGGREQTRTYYRWRGPNRRVVWPRFSNFIAFNHLLHQNSARYERRKGTLAWREREGYRASVNSNLREEAFAHLWDQQPAGLLHLLDESRCEPVHQFAVRAVRSLAGLVRTLDVPTALMLLRAPYEITVDLGVEVAQQLYTPAHPQRDLVLAVVDANSTTGRRVGHHWVESGQSHFLADGAFLARLITSQWADTRNLGRRLLRAAILPAAVSRALVEQLIEQLLALGAGEEAKALDIGDTLARGFSSELPGMDAGWVRRLLEHPLEGAQELGAQILLAQRQLPAPELLRALLSSPFASVRAAALRLVSQQTDLFLSDRPPLLLALLVNPQQDVREAALPLLRRLLQARPSLGGELAAPLAQVLLDSRAPDEVVAAASRLLRSELVGSLGSVGEDTVWALIRSKAGAAQEIGGLLLPRLDASKMEMDQIVMLADHEILALRQAAWAICEEHLDKVRQDIFQATRMLDARWEDTRQFVFALMRDRLAAEDFTPAALVSVCDSVRPEVQRLGQELLLRHFRQESGPEYMLRLSEHPSSNMQLLVTNYLEQHAAGHPERLEALEPYFVRALSQVNRGGLAKKRIFAFLQSQAQTSQEAAQVVGRIMSRISGTMAVQAKAASLEIMVGLTRRWPQVETPLELVAPSRRGGA